MVSAVIPAFNEAATVGEVVSIAIGHPDILEVIVVDDGSTDNTARAAERAGARVVRLDNNCGKAGALEAGVRAARHDIILFMDADVTGQTNESLSRIMQPVVDGRFEMYVGLRARKTLWLNRLLRLFPIIGGERALTRRLWEAVPRKLKNRFQIEIALNYTAKQFERGMGFELVTGTVHRVKERKYGVLPGLLHRLGMIVDILMVSIRLYVLGTIARIATRFFKKLRLLARTS
jgi:polyprenyl-phospho-N-acetylgalactosaminyl synthase